MSTPTQPTPTPPIAEIVWGITSQPCINRREPERVSELTARDCEQLNCREWVAADGRREYSLADFGEPSVDDMLAWLADDGFWVNINNAYDHAGGIRQWQVSVARIDGDGYNDPVIEYDRHETDGSTLLAALEAAVRCVADPTNPTPKEPQ